MYDVVLFSTVFNFLAERTLETLGETAHVVHAWKDPDRPSQMNHDHVALEEVVDGRGPDGFHCRLTEAVIAKKRLASLSSPVIVFIDHDVAWEPGVFKMTAEALSDAILSGASVAWLKTDHASPLKVFCTCPAFAVDPGALQGRRWTANQSKRLDTGEELSMTLSAENPASVKLVDVGKQRVGAHVGGGWRDADYARRCGRPFAHDRLQALQRITAEQLDAGGFHPDAYDETLMRRYEVFHRWLDSRLS